MSKSFASRIQSDNVRKRQIISQRAWHFMADKQCAAFGGWDIWWLCFVGCNHIDYLVALNGDDARSAMPTYRPTMLLMPVQLEHVAKARVSKVWQC